MRGVVRPMKGHLAAISYTRRFVDFAFSRRCQDTTKILILSIELSLGKFPCKYFVSTVTGIVLSFETMFLRKPYTIVHLVFVPFRPLLAETSQLFTTIINSDPLRNLGFETLLPTRV
jgi:hypothetical protein